MTQWDAVFFCFNAMTTSITYALLQNDINTELLLACYKTYIEISFIKHISDSGEFKKMYALHRVLFNLSCHCHTLATWWLILHKTAIEYDILKSFPCQMNRPQYNSSQFYRNTAACSSDFTSNALRRMKQALSWSLTMHWRGRRKWLYMNNRRYLRV